MKSLIFLISLLFLMSCTKEYSSSTTAIAVQSDTYVSPINGVTGNYYRVTISISTPKDHDIYVSYQSDELGVMSRHIINKGSTANVLYSMILAPTKESKVHHFKLLKVEGDDELYTLYEY